MSHVARVAHAHGADGASRRDRRVVAPRAVRDRGRPSAPRRPAVGVLVGSGPVGFGLGPQCGDDRTTMAAHSSSGTSHSHDHVRSSMWSASSAGVVGRRKGGSGSTWTVRRPSGVGERIQVLEGVGPVPVAPLELLEQRFAHVAAGVGHHDGQPAPPSEERGGTRPSPHPGRRRRGAPIRHRRPPATRRRRAARRRRPERAGRRSAARRGRASPPRCRRPGRVRPSSPGRSPPARSRCRSRTPGRRRAATGAARRPR